MAKNIVILTGSFNPITKAHRLILETAVKKVDAELGLFVLTNDAYLTRKLIVDSKEPSPFHLSEDIRKEMIDTLSKTNPKLKFGIVELGNESPTTYRTICKLKKQYKDYKIYLLEGADKLKGLSHWENFDKFFNDFNLIVFPRNNIDVQAIIHDNDLLCKNKDKIILLDELKDIEGISSTFLRNQFFKNEDYKNLMDEGPYTVLSRFKPADFPPVSNEDIIKNTLLYGGRFGGNRARKKVYKDNIEYYNRLKDKEFYRVSKVYKEEFKVNSTNSYNTITGVENKSVASVAYSLISEECNPAILNLASNYQACGGFKDGALAQEESLCYMSTLPMSLYQFYNKAPHCLKTTIAPFLSNQYPMDINFGGIYSKNVLFFRNDLDEYYSYRTKTFTSSVITVASLSNREKNNYTDDERFYFNNDGFLNEEGLKIEKNKIRTIYRIALENGHDSLVLGAFGCGVYNLKSSEVSKLFKEILEETEFKNKFKKIIFAIYEGKGSSRKVVGRDGKYKPFYDYFC